MALRSLACLMLLCVAPGATLADGFGIPGFLPGDGGGPRPSYRESYNHYPPPQHNVLGMRTRTPRPEDRPSYREAYDAFPPEGGRYGGGIIEYVLTGGRPEPIPQRVQVAPPVQAQPVYAAPAYAAPVAIDPSASLLPRSGLPDYAPQQPPAFFGGGQVGPQSSVEPALAEPAGPTPQLAAYTGAGANAMLGLAAQPSDPAYLRQQVAYFGRERAGTIVIDTPNKYLYLVEGSGQALRYGIGVGRPGFAWAGIKHISRKASWPDWTPPREMLARRPDLPRHMDGGEANPLGARALYLGSSLYRIHGTNQPYTIGTNVSSGCIRMMNQDVIDLYGRVGVGTRVVVL